MYRSMRMVLIDLEGEDIAELRARTTSHMKLSCFSILDIYCRDIAGGSTLIGTSPILSAAKLCVSCLITTEDVCP